MAYFPEEVVEQILGYVTSHRDRNSASLVCRAWYHIDCRSRRSVLVSNCYAVCPERTHVRFPSMRSLSVKGKPCSDDFNLVLAGWGAAADPWVDSCARICPGLEELRLKRMVVTDECLKLIAGSLTNLKSLVLVSCQGLTTAGLATIATNCRLLKELDMHKTIVKHQDHRWLDCFPKASTSLESLNFACLRGEVDAFALERLVARSPNLKRLRLNCSVPIDVLSRILRCRPKLEDLGTGSSVRGNTLGAYVTLSTALGNCSSLKSLSGFWDAKSLFVQGFFPVYKNLTFLNLNSFTLIQRDLINIIRQCRKLNVLWLVDRIGDEGLKVVAISCPDLQELRVFRGHENATTVTEEGLVAISSGCRKLQSVVYFCNRMTNVALITIAKNCPQLTSFRLRIHELRSADAITGQPLDEGFGAIVQSCKRLKRLSMCGLLTDCVFLYIGMYAEKLEMLPVRSAEGTDDSIVYVLNGCKNLKKLEIRDSPCFGDTALLAGVGKYEAMRSLWMSSCNITLGACKTLASSLPSFNVEVINRRGVIIDGSNDAASMAKVENLYLYRTFSGPRADAPGFVSTL